MIRIARGIDGAPIAALQKALDASGFQWRTGDRHHADITIQPRTTIPGPREMQRDAWYDLLFTHPTLRPSPGFRGAEIEYIEIAAAGQLPAPPRIPDNFRIALAESITTDHLSEAHLRLHGGADEVKRTWTTQRNTAIRLDRSPDAYDWTAYADLVAKRVSALTPPVLTPGQRAHVGAVRLQEALWAVGGARASVEALVSNAVAAGDEEAAKTVRGWLANLTPGSDLRP